MICTLTQVYVLCIEVQAVLHNRTLIRIDLLNSEPTYESDITFSVRTSQ
jgi:hypothetical protein